MYGMTGLLEEVMPEGGKWHMTWQACWKRSCWREERGVWHDKVLEKGHAGGREMSYGMTGTGTGTREKEKASTYRGARPPIKPEPHPGKGKGR